MLVEQRRRRLKGDCVANRRVAYMRTSGWLLDTYIKRSRSSRVPRFSIVRPRFVPTLIIRTRNIRSRVHPRNRKYPSEIPKREPRVSHDHFRSNVLLLYEIYGQCNLERKMSEIFSRFCLFFVTFNNLIIRGKRWFLETILKRFLRKVCRR